MKPFAVAIVVLGMAALTAPLRAYPPAVGILGNSKTCLSCHVNNGPWTDEAKTLIDILDKESGRSLDRLTGVS